MFNQATIFELFTFSTGVQSDIKFTVHLLLLYCTGCLRLLLEAGKDATNFFRIPKGLVNVKRLKNTALILSITNIRKVEMLGKVNKIFLVVK
jgi:hypothetical protein